MTQLLRVLIIDDSPADRTLVIRELEREFPQLQVQEIWEATGFVAALEAGFDLVITDYRLRWTNGQSILETVKQQYPNCPVIMFTNTGDEEIAVEAMKAGLDDYILKLPNRYIRLPAAVRVALERAGVRRQAALLDIRLQGLLNQLKVGIFRASAEGGLIDSNPAFLDLLGIEALAQAEPLLNFRQPSRLLLSLPPPQRQEQEFELRRADGTIIWVFLSTAVSFVEGEPVIDGLMEDISDRKQTELQLQQLNETLEDRVRQRTAQLEAANQDLEMFSYSVSHDLQEPLRAIQGFGSLLLADLGDQVPERDRDYIQRILSSTDHAHSLIEDLLTYSRLSRADLPLQPINLSFVVADLLNQLEPQMQQQQAQIRMQPLAEVMGNRTTLNQVLYNLLSNAMKFVLPNVPPEVQVWTEQRGSQVRLWVQDNGIGIAPDSQQRIFKVFERLHSSEDYPGNGIGLAIVQKGIEQMGGQVGVESYLGQGSRFWFELLAGEP